MGAGIPVPMLARLAELGPSLAETYRDLHRHPELSYQEHRTARVVADRLRGLGYEVHDGIGGTGVVGVLPNGPGPAVLLRADMDALPVEEATGLPYASMETATDPGGDRVAVMHACGHDTHVACLLFAAELMATHRRTWSGTLIVLFQPAEELGSGAIAMLDDGLFEKVPVPDVALGQHVMPLAAGTIGTRSGPAMAAADGYRITVHGRGGHGSMPHLTVDPVLLAANIVVRLQGVVAREVPPGRTAVLTVGSLRAGIKENVIPDSAELKVCVRSYDENTRSTVIGALKRIVTGECAASGSPRTPEFEVTASFPVTENDAATTERVDRAFRAHFDHRRLITMRQLAGSEDFCRIPAAKGVPYIYWSFGGADPAKFPPGAQPDEFSPELPTNHSPGFAPVIEPTLSTGVQALLVAALAWLGE